MLGYPEQTQKPVSINTCKTISSLRTVMPRLNISIPQALPTTQSLMMNQVKKKKNKQKTNHKHPSPNTLPFQKVYILQVCGFLLLFLGTHHGRSCIWLQHLESTSKFHLCLFFLKHNSKRTGFLKKAKNNNVL